MLCIIVVCINIVIIQLDERYRNFLIFCYFVISPIDACEKRFFSQITNLSNFLALAGSKDNFYILSCDTLVLDIVFLVRFLNFPFVIYQIYITIYIVESVIIICFS